MKKKVLSVLLAAALFAGSAVAVNAQVFGDWPVSSQSGNDEDVYELVFDKEVYEVENSQTLDLKKHLTAYTKSGKAIVQEPALEWEITDNDLALALGDTNEEGIVSAYEDKGTAKVTVIASDGKTKASCTVKATSLKKATGFKLEKTSYQFPIGSDNKQKDGNGVVIDQDNYFVGSDVKVVPTPVGTRFSQEQIAYIRGNVAVQLRYNDNDPKNLNAEIVDFNVTSNEDDITTEGILYLLSSDVRANALPYNYEDGKNPVKYDGTAQLLIGNKEDGALADKKSLFPVYDNNRDAKSISARSIKASTVKAVDAERAARSGAITIEVGQTVDLNKYVKYGPSNANANTDGRLGEWYVSYYNDAATVEDYAVVKDHDLLGVAVGQLKAVNTFTTVDGRTSYDIEIPVKVVAKGTLDNGSTETEWSLSPASISDLEVGKTAWIQANNAPTDASTEMKWTVDNDVVTIVPDTGAGAKVFAKKAGTAKITVTYGDVTKTATVTVVAAGSVTPPVVTPDEPNPGTGDSLFANLF